MTNPEAQALLTLAGRLRALAEDCQNTDGWEGASDDLVSAAKALENLPQHEPAREHGDGREIARLRDVSRQRAIEIVRSQASGWRDSGGDYGRGIDEGFRLAILALNLLDPFGDEIVAALATRPTDAPKAKS